VSLRMTQAEREQFLAEVHVGVLAVALADDAPLTLPVWYSYQPGGVVTLTTGRGTRKARAIGAAGRFSLCVQDEQPPYKYVTVSGPAVVEDVDLAERLAMARRYLGAEGGDAFIAANAGAEGEDDQVAIRMAPERWLTADFGKGDA
jgi:PPOX class probable F420-dependent enzyme